jgi:hypothetical protein
MAEDDGLALAPILIINLDAVFCFDKIHVSPFRFTDAFVNRLGEKGWINYSLARANSPRCPSALNFITGATLSGALIIRPVFECPNRERDGGGNNGGELKPIFNPPG